MEDYEVTVNGEKYSIRIENDDIVVNGARVKKDTVLTPKRIEASGELEALIAVCLFLNQDEIPYNPA